MKFLGNFAKSIHTFGNLTLSNIGLSDPNKGNFSLGNPWEIMGNFSIGIPIPDNLGLSIVILRDSTLATFPLGILPWVKRWVFFLGSLVM